MSYRELDLDRHNKVGVILDVLCPQRLSAGKESTVVKELDGAVSDYANRPLDDEFLFQFLDAVTVKIRFELKAGKVKPLAASQDSPVGMTFGPVRAPKVRPVPSISFCGLIALMALLLMEGNCHGLCRVSRVFRQDACRTLCRNN